MNRKKEIWMFLASVVSAFALWAPAQALILTPDTLIGAIDSAKSGQAYEEGQLDSFCNCDVTLLLNITTSTFSTDDADNNYIDVAPNEPGRYLRTARHRSRGSPILSSPRKRRLSPEWDCIKKAG
jgi:hypothetical protein